jgi:hypothetical protein
MRPDPIEAIPNAPDDCCFDISCNDPRVVKSIRDGVCPLCDSPLDHSLEWLAALEIPCSSPVCSFVLKPHGKLSRNSH